MKKGQAKYFVHETAVVDEPSSIGNDTKIWHFSHIMAGATIGKKCVIGQNVFVGSTARIGNFVKIQNNVSVYEGVTLEDHVFCGPSCVFTNVDRPRSAFPRTGRNFDRTLVKKGTTIGANSTIVCGITLGEHSFIGAGSVVTKDVPAFALYVGNPARPLGWICECGEKLDAAQRGRKEMTCPSCARKYLKSGKEIKQMED
jgi:UDP-2-acetamido-3-amino-2,3-dideoxy-glucuronate N-acetyltransferase